MTDPAMFDDVPIFALLDREEKQVLAQQVSTRQFAKGETIFKTGDPGGHAYLVQRGRVHISLTDLAGEVVLVDVVDDGGLFGMSSLLARSDHLTTAVAMEAEVKAAPGEVVRQGIFLNFWRAFLKWLRGVFARK